MTSLEMKMKDGFITGNTVIRPFRHGEEDPEQLFRLFELTYGTSVNSALWEWKYLKNPRSSEIVVFVAEDEGKIIAATTRIPAKLRIDRRQIDAHFNMDTVVHPDFRRKGIMREIYEHTSRHMPVLFSKGTNPNMYLLLKKLGYRDIEPNTYMVNYLSIPKLLLQKFGIYTPQQQTANGSAARSDFKRVDRFGPEFDEFWDASRKGFYGVFERDSRYMNWRYIDIPGRNYQAFYRIKDGRPVSLIVLRIKAGSSSIVELVWDRRSNEEPWHSIEFAIQHSKQSGSLKVSYWGTLSELREGLKRYGFQDESRTPNFTVLADSGLAELLVNGTKIHYQDSEGDSEYV